MILTLTGNLLAERTLTFADWSPGKTQRAQSESFQVGGKGINVSKMLRRIGSPTTAWCFTGGAAGAECEQWLRSQGMPHRAFPTLAPTRPGLVVRGGASGETTFLGPDRPPDAAALRACVEALGEVPPRGTVLALCGSFPGWASIEAEPLRRALDHWADAGALVADSYGPPLQWLVERPVTLVKINRQEFDQLFPEADRSEPVLQRLEEAVRRWPVRQWIVTDGPGPVCYGGVNTLPGTVEPPPVEEVSPTGSGDVLFACVLHAIYGLEVDLAAAVAFALPYAAANAAHPGVAEFQLNNLSHGRSVQP